MEFATYGDMKNVITKLDDTEINGRRIRIIEQKPRGRRQRYVDCRINCRELNSQCLKCFNTVCVLLGEIKVVNDH